MKIKEVEDNTDRGMNKYGLAARHKDGKFHSFRHGKHTGSFDSAEELAKHQQDLIKDESVEEDAGSLTDQQKQGLQAIYKKYGNYEGYGNGDSLPIGNMEQVIDPGSTLWADDKEYNELDAYMKKMGYDGFSDAQDKDEDFFDNAMKEMPISSAMQDDISKVLGNDYYEKPSLARAAKEYMHSLGESANEELNRITKLAGLGEGASMLPYFKQDEKTWSFPDAWAKDEALDTPYMSNMSMRQFLDTLGYDSDFESASPVDAKEFIGRTTQWLQKNLNKPSAEIPTTVDRSGGGATMIGGGKPEGWDNRQVKHHNELARKILAKYPEVTHFGFN